MFMLIQNHLDSMQVFFRIVLDYGLYVYLFQRRQYRKISLSAE